MYYNLYWRNSEVYNGRFRPPWRARSRVHSCYIICVTSCKDHCMRNKVQWLLAMVKARAQPVNFTSRMWQLFLLQPTTFDATVHNEDTTLSHVIWAINRTKVLFHCMACKMVNYIFLLLSFTGWWLSRLVARVLCCHFYITKMEAYCPLFQWLQ